MKALIAVIVLLLTSANHASRVSHLQDCPQATLTCEKVPEKNYRYRCHVTTPKASDDDPPHFRWRVSAGELLDEPTADTRRVDVQGVKAESVNVQVEVAWKKCQSIDVAKLKLR